MLLTGLSMLAFLPLVVGLIIAAVVVVAAVAILAACLSSGNDDADENFSEDEVGSTAAT